MTFETKFRNFVGRLKNKEFSHQELVIVADELLKEYNGERKVNIESWKGKSSFSFVQVGETITVTKYQRPEKGAEPKEVRTEINIEDLRLLEAIIEHFSKYCELSLPLDKKGLLYIKSTDVGERFYQMPWKEIFSDRRKHNRFTIMLNVLDKKELIEYRGGRVYLK